MNKHLCGPINKKLKEKGFTFELPISYDSDTGIYYHSVDPKISQVLDWLRDEKKIHIGFGYSPLKKWRYVVMYMDDRFYNKPTLSVDGFINIEQAAVAGIEYITYNIL